MTQLAEVRTKVNWRRLTIDTGFKEEGKVGGSGGQRRRKIRAPLEEVPKKKYKKKKGRRSTFDQDFF